MKNLIIPLLILGAVVLNGARQPLEFYISVDGNDQATGSIEKPYATLPAAVDAVRALRRSGNNDRAVIYLREGRHQLNETLVLGIEDGSPSNSTSVQPDKPGSGTLTGPARLTIAAYPGESPVVSGGVPVTGWKLLKKIPDDMPESAVGKIWMADMPDGMERFYTLYDNKGRLNRARSDGFTITEPGGKRTLHFPEGALKNWENLEDVEIHIRPGRAAIAMGVEELDVSKMGLKEKPYAEEPTLLISDGSEFNVPEYYPEFSWRVTPQYFMFGDTERVLYPEEVKSIAARTGFICIEKSHGMKQLGAAELGAKHDVAAFKKEKPGIKVLFYFNSAWAWPFTSYNKVFEWNEIDKHPELKKFLVINPETGELNHRRQVFSFDVLNPEFRKWWVDTVISGVETSGADGVFIDQMHGFAWLRPDRSKEVERAMGELMASLKRKLGPDKILLGNNAHDDIARYVFPSIDANMFEHYSEKLLSKEALLRDWDDMLKIAKAGKMSIFRIGVEVDPLGKDDPNEEITGLDRHDRLAEVAKERLEYWLACYLIGAQPYAYFQYGWGWTLSSGSLYDYPDLHKPLGLPKGPYKRTDPDRWEFTREFEHASVRVDTEQGQGKITWR